MKMTRLRLATCSFALLFPAAAALPTQVWAACTATLALPTANATNSATFGDAISYGLPILGLDVQSSPGQINDCIVIATGSSGSPITTNFAGMDNAYATPSGTGGSPFFRTGDPVTSPDPGQVAAFTGDTATTWDIRIDALNSFLAGNDMVVYFNHNQTNSGGTIDQQLFIWAQIAVVDDQGVLPTQYFYVTSTPNTTGITNWGTPGGDPSAYTGPQTAATNTYPTGSDAAGFPVGGLGTGTGSGDARFFVNALGQVCTTAAGLFISCSDPTAVNTFNLNLGADHVAEAIIFPELQAILNNPGGYDVLQADIRMGCNPLTITGGVCPPGTEQNNGFEQIFISTLNPERVPEPGSIALLGLAFVVLAWFQIGRRKR